MRFQEFWDSCAQNKTSEISKTALPGTLGFLSAEHNVGNLKTALSGILGLLCADQDVGSLKKWTFANSGTPVRRTRRRKSQKVHFQEFCDSCAQNKTSEIQKKMDFQELWDSCAQNKQSEISKHELLGMLVLLYAEQNVGNIKN